MAESQSIVTADAAKSASPIRSVVPATQKSADHKVSSSALRLKHEFGSGSPRVAADSYGSPLQDLRSTGMQASALRHLQHSYGNNYVGGLIQRKCGCGGTCGPCREEEKIQRKGKGSLSAVPDHLGAAIQSSGSGSRMDAGDQVFMEGRFGRAFDSVRVHTDSSAGKAAGALNARAFTLGQHIYFSTDQYRPGDSDGRRLLAHELVHTVQQGSGSSQGMASKRSVSQPGDALEQQADAVAAQVMNGEGAVGSISSVGTDVAQRLELPSLGDIAAGAEAALDTAVETGEAAVGAVVGAAEAVGEAAAEAVDFFATEAGEAALSQARALASIFGCDVNIRGTCLEITCPEISLFPSFQKTLGETPPVGFFIPLLEGGAMIGPFPIAGMFGILGYAQGSLEAAIGPGVIRNIRVELCPLSGNYMGTAQLYVAAAIAPRLTLFGGLFAAAGTLIPVAPPIPIIVILQGGLRGTGTGWLIGAIQDTVTISYAAGSLSFSNLAELMGGILLTADLDLFAALRLFDKIICQYVYPLAHWEAGRAWRLTIPITAGFSGGRGSAGVGPITWGPMPIEDIQTAIRPLPTGWNCLSWQEIKKLLCDFGILPEDWCDEEEPGALKDITASGRCKCVGDDACGGGKIYEVCFRTKKDCKNAQKDLDNFCNNNSEMKKKCIRPKCYYRHSQPKCPDECDPGTITPLEEEPIGPTGPCPLPVNVRNGPFHAPIDEPDRAGMEIAITITSSTGRDADMATIEDKEQVSLSFNHTGSYQTLAPLPSITSSWMPGHPIPNDRHTEPRARIIDRADNHGGNGGYDKHQLDIFKAPACGITTPQAIPDSGYIIRRRLTVGPGTKIKWRAEKSGAACSVGGFTSSAGPSPTQGDDVIVRT